MVSAVLRDDSGAPSAAAVPDAEGVALGGVAARTIVCDGVAGRTARSGIGDAGAAALVAAALDDAALSTMPQWTQNFAPG
jgi:hypothetical protein